MTDEMARQAGRQAEARTRSNAEMTRIAVALVSGGLLAAFAVLNTDEVEVDWIIGTAQTPLIIVIVVSLGLGFGAGYLLARRGARARRRRQ